MKKLFSILLSTLVLLSIIAPVKTNAGESIIGLEEAINYKVGSVSPEDNIEWYNALRENSKKYLTNEYKNCIVSFSSNDMRIILFNDYTITESPSNVSTMSKYTINVQSPDKIKYISTRIYTPPNSAPIQVIEEIPELVSSINLLFSHHQEITKMDGKLHPSDPNINNEGIVTINTNVIPYVKLDVTNDTLDLGDISPLTKGTGEIDLIVESNANYKVSVQASDFKSNDNTILPLLNNFKVNESNIPKDTLTDIINNQSMGINNHKLKIEMKSTVDIPVKSYSSEMDIIVTQL